MTLIKKRENFTLSTLATVAIWAIFDAAIPFLVVAIAIDKHHTPQELKMEQLLVAVTSLFLITRCRDFLEHQFEKVLITLEDEIETTHKN